jgi:hypothetical protein
VIVRRIATLLLLVACGSSKPAPAPVGNTAPPAPAATPSPAAGSTRSAPDQDPDPTPISMEEVIAKWQEFRDQMCACSDKACVDRVLLAMKQASRSRNDTKVRFTREQEARVMRVMSAFAACAEKAQGAPLDLE